MVLCPVKPYLKTVIILIKHKYNRVGANTMKIYDIVSENNVNEAPGGSALGDLARKVGKGGRCCRHESNSGRTARKS